MTSRRGVLLVASVAVVAAMTAVVVWRPRATPEAPGAGMRVPDTGPESSAAGTAPPQAALNGVIYDLPWVAGSKDSTAVNLEFLKASTSTGLKWTNGTHTFEVLTAVVTTKSVRPDEIRLNGKNYGAVRSGDRVRLAPSGVLSVNGVERKPE